MNANLTARVDYLRSTSVIRQMRAEGTLDSVVARLITDLQNAGEDVPHHVMGLRSPSVIKALAAVDLLKSGGARREEEETPVQPAQAPKAQRSPATANAGGGAGKGQQAAPAGGGVAGKSQPDRGGAGAGADGGGQAAGSAVGEDGWEEFFKDPSEVVRAKKMTEPFTVKTLENRGGEVMHGKAGDYLVEGLRGDQWVVDGKIFDETYRNVDEWKQIKRTANPEKEAAKFDGKPPAQDQVGPARPETSQGAHQDAGGGRIMSTSDIEHYRKGGKVGEEPETKPGAGQTPVNGGKGGIDPKDLPKNDKPGAQQGVNRHPSAQQDDQGAQPQGRLTLYDRTKGFGIYENPSADELFAAVEEWEESGDYPVHFGEAMVNHADSRESGGKDHYEGANYIIGLKSGGKWAGFMVCRMHPDKEYSGLVVEYLETAPHHRGAEAEQAGAGTRLLAAAMERADGQKVVINAMTETAGYFQKAGAKHLGGTRYVFDQPQQEAFLNALDADAKGAPVQKALTEMSGYERRKAAKAEKPADQQGALNAQTLYAAESALPHGLLIGPVHEAANARVKRYYTPDPAKLKQGARPKQGAQPMQKSLQIFTPSQLRDLMRK